MAEEKSKEEKPKYDKAIKSTKDVVDEKLKDKKLDYGQEHSFDKYAQEILVDLPKKTNDITIELNAEIYACLKKYKDKGVYNLEEVGKTADELYETASNVVLKTIGFDGFKPKNKDGEIDLEDLVKSYIGNLDKKAFKKGLEEQYNQVGYLDEGFEALQKNILKYPAGTFHRKRQQNVEREVEEEISTIEGFEKLKKDIKSLAEKLNKPVTDEEIFIPNKAWSTYIKLKNIGKVLQTL